MEYQKENIARIVRQLGEITEELAVFDLSHGEVNKILAAIGTLMRVVIDPLPPDPEN